MLHHIVETNHHAVKSLGRCKIANHGTNGNHSFLVAEIAFGVGKRVPLPHSVFVEAYQPIGCHRQILHKQFGNSIYGGRTTRQYHDVAVMGIQHHGYLLQ